MRSSQTGEAPEEETVVNAHVDVVAEAAEEAQTRQTRPLVTEVPDIQTSHLVTGQGVATIIGSENPHTSVLSQPPAHGKTSSSPGLQNETKTSSARLHRQ